MKLQSTHWHWVATAAVLAIALLTLSEAHGQSTGAAAVFEGRPAMAGAQGGTGPMAGPAQGGIAPQGTGDPRGGVELRRPAAVPEATAPVVPRDPGLDRPTGREDGAVPRRDRDPGNVIKRDRDDGAASQQNRASKKAQRAGKRTLERARRGVSGVDS